MYVDVDTYRFTVNEYIILDPDTIIFTVYVDIAKKQIYNEPKHRSRYHRNYGAVYSRLGQFVSKI